MNNPGDLDPHLRLMWEVLTCENDCCAQVVPLNDIREHEMEDCWCHPRVEQDARGLGSGTFYVHNSADRREHTFEKGWVH
jgi:hypothetical protein